MLIGADGLHSTIRKQLHGDTELRYSGYTVWRAMPPFQDDRVTDAYPHQAVGPGGGFGLHPKGELMYWFGSMVRPEGAPDPPEGRKHELMQHFGGWYDPIPAAIEATPDEAIFRSDIYDRKPLERWGTGRVTLLGDAAHATTPAMGQGAGMTIEDAAVLAEELSLDPGLGDGEKIAEALRARTRDAAAPAPPRSSTSPGSSRRSTTGRTRSRARCGTRCSSSRRHSSIGGASSPRSTATSDLGRRAGTARAAVPGLRPAGLRPARRGRPAAPPARR